VTKIYKKTVYAKQMTVQENCRTKLSDPKKQVGPGSKAGTHSELFRSAYVAIS